jgi:formate dehydrogenase iron-sulfur subunit
MEGAGVMTPETRAVWIPRDAAALSLGAERVADAVSAEAARRGANLRIVRNGTRGMCWLEPLVEIETAAGRIGYGPVTPRDVPTLFDADFLNGGAHPLLVGPVAAIPYFAKQERLTFERVGLIDPVNLDEYLAHGGYQGLQRALAIGPAAIVREVTDSGLRGRGGAAFPTGIKWKTVLDEPADQKFVTCNADEGDSGTFADRMLMEGDPFTLIEGMTIAAFAVGATEGYIYLRVEYPHAHRALRTAIATAYERGYLGQSVLGSGKRFDLEIRLGAGAYICGEETSMLESLEGKRGEVRPRPPLPAVKGLFGQPTIVNNVISLASVPIILRESGAFYRDYGMGRSRGTLTIQLGGNIRRGGLIEKAFGATVREILYDYGGGSSSGRPIRAVQVGGPLGAYLPESQFDTPLDYEAFSAIGALVGHGGIVAFDDTVDMAQMARYAMEFCALESCGKCTPCRIGSTRGVEVIDRVVQGADREANLILLDDLCDTLLNGSLCGLGGLTPYPVQSALKYFRDDFLKA